MTFPDDKAMHLAINGYKMMFAVRIESDIFSTNISLYLYLFSNRATLGLFFDLNHKIFHRYTFLQHDVVFLTMNHQLGQGLMFP